MKLKNIALILCCLFIGLCITYTILSGNQQQTDIQNSNPAPLMLGHIPQDDQKSTGDYDIIITKGGSSGYMAVMQA